MLRFSIALLLLCFSTEVGKAQELEAIDNNDYSVELVPGPVLGSSRMVGMAGAFTALSSGVLGAAQNPAAYAVRQWHDLDFFEWELDGGVMFPGAFSKSDYFNNGLGTGLGTDSFFFANAGLRLHWWRIAVGASIDAQRFTVGQADRRTDVTTNYFRFGVGSGFFRSQLVLGAGLVSPSLSLSDNGSTGDLFSASTTVFEFGAVLGLQDQPWRAGMSFRTASSEINIRRQESRVDVVDDVASISDFVLPNSLATPWILRAGFAWMIGPRRLNHAWERIEPARVKVAHYRNLDRSRKESLRKSKRRWWWPKADRQEEMQEDTLDEDVEAQSDAMHAKRRAGGYYVLLSADIELQGATDNAVGVDAFTLQQARRAGEEVTVIGRLGIESELIEQRLRLQAGSYLEPSRYKNVRLRAHVTGGVEVRIVKIPDFLFFSGFDLAIRGSFDWARDYLNWGIGIGVWH